MFLDTKEIRDEALVFDRTLRIADLEGVGGEPIRVSEARMAGEASRGKDGVDLAAHLDADLRIACSRCLEPFALGISTDFYLTLVPEGRSVPAGDDEQDKDLYLFAAPEGKADLVQMAAEQIYLNLPLKPVCAPSCRGLCPVCGRNKNMAECGCGTEEVDPRLTPLLQLKERHSRS